jgi:GTP-binding protein EngB required for normal cell division
VPVIVVFTKLDKLRTQVVMEMFANRKKKEFYADVEKEVTSRIEKLCVIPLREATSGHSYPYVAVSSLYCALTASI